MNILKKLITFSLITFKNHKLIIGIFFTLFNFWFPVLVFAAPSEINNNPEILVSSGSGLLPILRIFNRTTGMFLETPPIYVLRRTVPFLFHPLPELIPIGIRPMISNPILIPA
jgi:hypothetical protein